MTNLLVKEGGYDVVYEFIAPSVDLGGNNRNNYHNIFNFYQELGELDTALIDIAVLLAEPDIRRWKVALEGVVLTREFKPYICAKLSKGYACKLLFDVTPIISSKPEKQYRVDITHTEIREAKLIHLGMLTVFRSSGCSGRIVYVSDMMTIPPGEETVLELPSRLERAELRFSAFMPHGGARLVVSSDEGTVATISGYQGGFEAAYSVGKASSIRLRHEGDGRYLPREVVVPSLLVYSVARPQPLLSIKAAELRGDKASVTVSNEGDAAAGNIIVVSICLGTVRSREVIGSLAPGESRTLELKACEGGSTTIRVIWRWRGEMKLIEHRFRQRQ